MPPCPRTVDPLTKEPPVKTIRRLVLISVLALGATACGSASLLAPDCEDPTACPYQPGPNGYQPGPNG